MIVCHLFGGKIIVNYHFIVRFATLRDMHPNVMKHQNRCELLDSDCRYTCICRYICDCEWSYIIPTVHAFVDSGVDLHHRLHVSSLLESKSTENWEKRLEYAPREVPSHLDRFVPGSFITVHSVISPNLLKYSWSPSANTNKNRAVAGRRRPEPRTERARARGADKVWVVRYDSSVLRRQAARRRLSRSERFSFNWTNSVLDCITTGVSRQPLEKSTWPHSDWILRFVALDISLNL